VGAIPAIVKDLREIDELVRHVEVRYQGNADPNVCWALLTDWADAPQPHAPADERLLKRAADGIIRLNATYGCDGRLPFLLLHRQRLWNPREGCWMGWERKRGKLHELNRFILGADDTGLEVVEGDGAQLRGIRFVITLDADTHLPPGAAARLIGALAHPLNAARFDEWGRVTTGYTVLQPGLETGMESEEPSLFIRIMEADTGLDLYSHAVSDVYQDLFGEGIYAGKGIYEVAAFERSLEDRVPDNALLSHDLFEGVHGRAGLVSDIHLFEDSPADVVSYMRRLHRWIRGDWQLLPWIFPRVPARHGGRVPNRLGFLDRWKIFDNLRRSLLAPSLVALLLTGWFLEIASPWVWTGFALGVLGVPSFLGAASATRRLIGNRRGRRWHAPAFRGPIDIFGPPAWASLGRWLLTVVFLPYSALVSLDAIVRTLVRLTITRRHLLEWTSAAHTERVVRRRRLADDAGLLGGTLAAVAVLAGLLILRSGAIDAAAVLAVPWVASPLVAAVVSRRPRLRREEAISAADERLLRLVALRTWLYFERLLTSEDHWLPPDNYQEGRAGAVARRTSPTNMGMMFTAALSAWDLGYIGPLEVAAITLNALDSMRRLERYRGHFLNWYATDDLRALHPRYVSTVDSGNLAVALITLRSGLREVIRAPALRPELVHGLVDALESAEVVVELAAWTAWTLLAGWPPPVVLFWVKENPFPGNPQ
jgi:cyclic beta-1,2-glucan synthetase